MSILDLIIEWVLDLISSLGYAGITFLMALESMCIPIPSEVVMPFGGWLTYDGRFDFLLVVLAGTLGCVIGSSIAYWIGYTGGRELVLKYGRYVLINRRHLASVEGWFQKYGMITVFVTRLLPVVRTFISLPIGVAKYPFRPFVILTAISSFIWCLILTYIGYNLGPRWEEIEQYFRGMDIIIIIGVIIFVIWWIVHTRRSNKECLDDQE